MITPALLHLASQQFGVLSRAQLSIAGVSTAALSRARRVGHDRRRHQPNRPRAVVARHFLARCTAVSLHLGDRGFVAGATAGRLHGLREMTHRTIYVTIPDGHRVRPARRGPASDRRRGTTPIATARRSPASTPLQSHTGCCTTSRRASAIAVSVGPPRTVGTSTSSHLSRPTTTSERHRRRGKDGTARIERWLDMALDQQRPAQSGLRARPDRGTRAVGLPGTGPPASLGSSGRRADPRRHRLARRPALRRARAQLVARRRRGRAARPRARAGRSPSAGRRSPSTSPCATTPHQAAQMIRRAFHESHRLVHGRAS